MEPVQVVPPGQASRVPKTRSFVRSELLDRHFIEATETNYTEAELALDVYCEDVERGEEPRFSMLPPLVECPECSRPFRNDDYLCWDCRNAKI